MDEEEDTGPRTVVQTFVAWFEREEIGKRVDEFVVNNAHRMLGHVEGGGENSHDWWPIYLEYQGQFEILLQEFLDEAACSMEEFLRAAESADGMEDFYIKLFLAHSEFEMFVEMMGQEALKQAAENDLGL